jgi:hypothetical protein
MKATKKKKKSSGAMALEYEVHLDNGVSGGFEAFGTKKEAQDRVRELVKDGRSLKQITVYSYRTLSTERFLR